MTIEQIIRKIKKNNPKEDITLVKLAYEFAEKAHKGQKRKTGEPYIQHSLTTAFILAQIKADTNTVIAGILHDVPEDTEKTLDEIKKDFGKEIATLVNGITKLSKIKYRGVKRYKENLKKMFLAMSQDRRVILIKFVDRLHNLRTLDVHSPEKIERIAKETMEIYVPIAGLLGIWRLKWQLEDLCFKFLYPKKFKKIEYEYEVEKKVERNQYIQKIKNILNQKLKKENIKFKIEGRFKHLYSIYKKMQKKDRKFNEIHDVFALRIIVSEITDCYKILGIIHTLWKPKPNRIKDYIAMPKPNGYRSLHTTVFGPKGKATEFQIKTQEMNNEALYGMAAHWRYKEDKKTQQPRWIKELLNIQHETKDTNDFISKIKFNIFKNRIFVFSPSGDVFELPEKSTPIDFAYAVHTEIGNKAIGCMVNDKMSTLDQELKNGDSVEIIIEKNKKNPSKKWLKFVKTRRAKSKINQHVKKYSFDKIKKFIPKI